MIRWFAGDFLFETNDGVIPIVSSVLYFRSKGISGEVTRYKVTRVDHCVYRDNYDYSGLKIPEELNNIEARINWLYEKVRNELGEPQKLNLDKTVTYIVHSVEVHLSVLTNCDNTRDNQT